MKTSDTHDSSQASASQTRRTTMTDQHQSQQVQTSTEDRADSFRETSQTVVDSILAIQEFHVKLTHSLFLNWMELLTMQRRQPTQKQQDPFQRLMATPMQLYLDFLFAPLTLSRKLVEASMAATQHERELVP
jgi:hypothetical protein